MKTSSSSQWQRAGTFVRLLMGGVGFCLLSYVHSPAFAQSPVNSGPIAITPNDSFVWMVNPDNDSVSVFDVRNDVNARIALLPTGKEPQSVAIHPSGTKAYVTNMADGTVSVFRTDPTTGASSLCGVIKVGVEPYGAAVTPNGKHLYVANASSDTVSIIKVNTQNDPDCKFGNRAVLRTIHVDDDPRGIAITADGSKVYVTHFFAQLRPGKTAADEGRDDQREGRVTVISTSLLSTVGRVALNPLADTGFKADGSTLDRDPCQVAGCTTARTVTGAFPNLLQSIAIKGNRAYLPNTAASPNGPFRFNVNVQSFLSVFDTTTDQDSGQTINMNKGSGAEDPSTKLFLTNPFAIAFKHSANEGFVAAKAINQIIKVTLDASGTPTINAPTPVRVNVGKDPRGIVINSTDTRAYVMNFISRDFSVVDISTPTPSVLGTVAQSDLLPTLALDQTILRGKELFMTAIGPAGTTATSDPPAGRMSSEGWGDCYSCHEDGRTDNVTWMFADGPRQAISMDSTFDPHDATKQRILNWSPVRDEVQDFELNIRGVSGGQGLITDGNPVVNLTPTANTGRSTDLDAIATFLQFGVRSRIAPKPSTIKRLTERGSRIFTLAGCATCHGGGAWSRSIRDYTPPPGGGESIVDGQLTRFLKPVGTFDATLFSNGTGNEIRANTVGTTTQARGADGFNPPSLLGVFATAPYFHNGSAQTLEDVILSAPQNPADVHSVKNEGERATLLRFLKTIDDSTSPLP